MAMFRLRPIPIIMVVIVAAACVLGARAFVNVHARAKIHVDDSEEDDLGVRRWPEIGGRDGRHGPNQRAVRGVLPSVPLGEPPPDAGYAQTLAAPSPAVRLLWRRLSLLRQADEVAFQSLEVAEPMRVAIRTIDGEFRPGASTLAELDREGALQVFANEQERGRREAIEKILPRGSAGAFFAMEAAETRLREARSDEQLALAHAPRSDPPGVTSLAPRGQDAGPGGDRQNENTEDDHHRDSAP